MINLCNLAQVRAGYTFRHSLKGASQGNTAVIQTKDATPQALAQSSTLARVDLPKPSPDYLLQEGDLIFRSRGLLHQALALPGPVARTVCAAPLLFIRIKPQCELLPGYLAWYINLAATQAQIGNLTNNDAFRTVKASALASLPIILPTLARQRTIVDMHALHEESCALALALSEKRLLHMETTLLRYARGIE